jgi:hypothetical protein
MSRLSLITSLLFALLCLSAALTTDAEIESMTLKELRKFLSDRQLRCTDCVEKGHLVEFAKQNKDAEIRPPGKPDAAPDFDIEQLLAGLKEKRQKDKDLRAKLRAQGMDIPEPANDDWDEQMFEGLRKASGKKGPVQSSKPEEPPPEKVEL